jgi:hypothetical protein
VFWLYNINILDLAGNTISTSLYLFISTRLKLEAVLRFIYSSLNQALLCMTCRMPQKQRLTVMETSGIPGGGGGGVQTPPPPKKRVFGKR